MITDNYLLFIADTDKITDDFTFLYFKKKYISFIKDYYLIYAHLRV